jgi:DNA sulfur modification protein DndB
MTVVSFRRILLSTSRVEAPLRFDRSESFGDTAFGKLTLPGRYGAAWVIDGQHRLYGFAYWRRRGGGGKAVIPVLAYENLSVMEEMRQFVTINCEQVKVSRNLVNEILSNLNYESDDPIERATVAICANRPCHGSAGKLTDPQ